MKPTHPFSAGLLACCSLVGAASGQLLEMQFDNGHSYLQDGPFNAEFLGGQLGIRLRDGEIIIFTNCVDNGGPFLVYPYQFCPQGTTGFIADGDADGDGIRDSLAFWSISEVVPASTIEPFFPDQCQLISAPPTDLPRPLGPFDDQGIVTFFNVLTAVVRQYDATRYEFIRSYPAGPVGRAQIKDELVPGSYRFIFPLINNPTVPLALAVTHVKMPEAIDPADRYPENGFYFTSGRWDGDGYYLMDPRVTNTVTWTGNNTQNTFAGDQFYLTIRDLDPVTGTSPNGIVFPPAGLPVQLDSPTLKQYSIPPFFFEPGDFATWRLQMERGLASSAVAFDTSSRLFQFNIRFVDAYSGFQILNFPSGADTGAIGGNSDFDGDGASNQKEYGFGTDPADAASVPVPPAAIPNGDGTVTFTFAKRVNGVASYQFTVSKNGGPSRVITGNDAEWDIVTDDATTLTITTKNPVAVGDTFTSDVVVRALSL